MYPSHGTCPIVCSMEFLVCSLCHAISATIKIVKYSFFYSYYLSETANINFYLLLLFYDR